MLSKPFPWGQPRLENEVLVLEPFNPDVHIKRIVDETTADPDFLHFSAFPNAPNEDFWRTNLYDPYLSTASGGCCYAVLDKRTDPGLDGMRNYAGLVALINTKPEDAFVEIGIMIFPAFHRTHVASNAIGLALLYLLDPPSAGGLGLRRVEWQANSVNEVSRNFALRMGFELEGVLRWWGTMESEKASLPVDALEKRNGTKNEPAGKHNAIYSIVWDEWDEKRPIVVARMERRP